MQAINAIPGRSPAAESSRARRSVATAHPVGMLGMSCAWPLPGTPGVTADHAFPPVMLVVDDGRVMSGPVSDFDYHPR